MEIAVVIVVSIISIFVGISINGTDYDIQIIFLLSMLLFAIIAISVGMLQTNQKTYYKEGYKQGNIDGYNCIYKYHLEIQSDSSIIWVENKK